MTVLDAVATLDDRLDNLPEYLAEIAKKFDVPGISVAVLHGDTAATFTYGVASVDTQQPVTPGTLFKIGSNTKLYTATVVMKLVEDGLVELDMPVSTYLPEFQLDHADVHTITVRHLLSHRGGFQGDFVGSLDIDWGIDAIERYVAELAAVEILHPVGERWSYCNSGYVVLGRLIEVVTGQAYGDAVRSLLLDAIGDRNTQFHPQDLLNLPCAAGHMPNPETAEQEVMPAGHAPGAVPAGSFPYSTARDVIEFVRMHLNGGLAADGTRVVAESTVQAMQTPQVDVPLWGHRTSWGLGWALGALPDGTRLIGHGGAAAGQVSALEVLPDERLAVVVLTNSTGGGAAAPLIVNRILETLVDKTLAAPVTLPDPPVILDLEKYAGRYGDSVMTIDASVGDGVLMVTVTPAEIPGLPKSPPFTTPLVPLDPERFAIPVPGADTVLRFCDLDDDGRPRYFFSSRVHPRIS